MELEKLPINLDAEERETLLAYARGFKQLARYAAWKAAAQKLRLAGDINGALRHESNCDKLYKELPEWAKGW